MSTSKKVLFSLASIAIGIFAQIHKTKITGPIFEPILQLCSAPHESVEAFHKETGFQQYEPLAGMGIFTPLVCVVTEFMYRLCSTYPEGHIAWGLAVVGVLPMSVIMTIEGGRKGARGPLRYPIVMGIIHQILGQSVSIPLIWVPAYIWGRGKGPVNTTRIYLSLLTVLPAVILSVIVFTVDTNSYLWRLAAGILGGPGLAIVCGSAFWFDNPPCKISTETIAAHMYATKRVYGIITLLSLTCWAGIVHLIYKSYGFNMNSMYSSLLTDANEDAGIEFLTLDYILIYVGIIVGYVAYIRLSAALQVLITFPFIGPAALTIVAEKLELDECNDSEQKIKFV